MFLVRYGESLLEVGGFQRKESQKREGMTLGLRMLDMKHVCMGGYGWTRLCVGYIMGSSDNEVEPCGRLYIEFGPSS